MCRLEIVDKFINLFLRRFVKFEKVKFEKVKFFFEIKIENI